MSPRTSREEARSLRLDATAPVFAALGDQTRLELVARLASGPPLSIAHLTQNTGVTRQAVSHHLDVLKEAGLVRGTWRGREHVWQLEPARIAIARRSLDEISRWWDERLSELADAVEGQEDASV